MNVENRKENWLHCFSVKPPDKCQNWYLCIVNCDSNHFHINTRPHTHNEHQSSYYKDFSTAQNTDKQWLSGGEAEVFFYTILSKIFIKAVFPFILKMLSHFRFFTLTGYIPHIYIYYMNGAHCRRKSLIIKGMIESAESLNYRTKRYLWSKNRVLYDIYLYTYSYIVYANITLNEPYYA